jgi:hypothetical protein
MKSQTSCLTFILCCSCRVTAAAQATLAQEITAGGGCARLPPVLHPHPLHQPAPMQCSPGASVVGVQGHAQQQQAPAQMQFGATSAAHLAMLASGMENGEHCA